MLHGLAEADPGVEADPLLGDPCRDGDREPLLEERGDLGDDVVVARVACIVRGSPSMCIRQR